MYLRIKYLSLLSAFMLLISFSSQAQDDASSSGNSTILLAVGMPESIDGLTDASVAQLGNKLTAIVTSNNFATDSADRTFTIYPKFDVGAIAQTATAMRNFYVANCTLYLFIKQTATGTIFSQCIVPLKGIGDTKEEAIANAVTGISPDDAVYQKFIDRAKAKIIAYFQANCQVFMTKAEREMAQGHYDEATKTLSPIPQETGQCYTDAQQKIADIFAKQYGSLDKAEEHFQQEVTVDPASSIFSKLLDKAKNQIKKRNDGDTTPPEVDLLTPKTTRGQGVEADVTPDHGIYVSGTARDPSGIGSLTVNGIAVTDITADGFFQTNVSKDVNDIVVVASDKKGNTGSVTFHITSKTEPQASGTTDAIMPITDNEVFHAIFIANTNYTGDKWPPLNTTIEEAKSVIKVLEDKYNFKPENVDTLFNRSRIDILSVVKDRLSKLTPNDNLVLFYGGHGYFVESTNMAYWVPINTDNEFSYISNTDISTLLNGCQARHILVMADACFSGAMRGGFDAPTKYEYKFNSRQLLTSGGTEPVPGKSAYINMVLTFLNNNTDKYISARELYNGIFKGIMDQTKTEPTLRDLQVSGSQGGQFYFRKN